ncbi:hypothetical protein CVH13_00255, partial [Dehalococcoides mccartyi]
MGILGFPSQGSSGKILSYGPPRQPNNQVAINAALQSVDSSDSKKITTVEMKDGKWTITT